LGFGAIDPLKRVTLRGATFAPAVNGYIAIPDPITRERNPADFARSE